MIARRLAAWRIAQLDGVCAIDDFTPDRPDQYCPRCGATAGPGSVTAAGCTFCLGHRFHWQRLTRLGEYAPPLDQAIREMKFGRYWAQAGWFGRALAKRVEVYDPAKTLVTFVPMHRFRQWSRGFNQAELIADALATARGLEVLPLLRRVRHTPPQTALPRTGRLTNLTRAFAAYPVDLAGYDVLLVDDVKTTGTTLAGCARLLRRQGARTVHCVVVAAADSSGGYFAMT